MPLLRRIAVLAGVLAAAAVWSGAALADVPGNTTLPQISGRPDTNSWLTADNGVWSGSPTGYTYQWQGCDATGAGCVDIGGATGASLPPGNAVADHTVRVEVTATNADGSTTAVSPPLAITSQTVGTPHVLVHYTSDGASPAAISQSVAGDLAAMAERAYNQELGLGYPAIPSDGAAGGDSRIDIYVVDIGDPWVWGYALGSYVEVDGTNKAEVAWLGGIAHELFHLIQFTMFPGAQAWLAEGTAEWMAYTVDQEQRDPDLGNWAMSLDCVEPNGPTGVNCDLTDRYKDNGYSRWPFFEYVSELYGSDFVKKVYADYALGAPTALDAISAAILGQGSNLAAVFNGFSVANLTGGYSMAVLQAIPPQVYGSPIYTGTLASLNATTPTGSPQVTSAAIPTTTVPVDHLSARYVALARGKPASPDTTCYSATLALRVDLPPGLGSATQPYFWWSQVGSDGSKQAAVAFAVDGNTGTATVPWDTCDWKTTYGYVSLANTSTANDAQDFKLSGTITVDPTKPVNLTTTSTTTTTTTTTTVTTPSGPPTVNVHGQVVDAGSYNGAPTIDVFGPQLITIGAGAKSLRLIVQSDDSGKLQASLGSTSLESQAIRPGGNDLRFALPTKVVASLERTKTTKSAKPAKKAAGALTLTLTPLSDAGSAGKPVTRQVVMVAAKTTTSLAARR